MALFVREEHYKCWTEYFICFWFFGLLMFYSTTLPLTMGIHFLATLRRHFFPRLDGVLLHSANNTGIHYYTNVQLLHIIINVINYFIDGAYKRLLLRLFTLFGSLAAYNQLNCYILWEMLVVLSYCQQFLVSSIWKNNDAFSVVFSEFQILLLNGLGNNSVLIFFFYVNATRVNSYRYNFSECTYYIKRQNCSSCNLRI